MIPCTVEFQKHIQHKLVLIIPHPGEHQKHINDSQKLADSWPIFLLLTLTPLRGKSLDQSQGICFFHSALTLSSFGPCCKPVAHVLRVWAIPS